MALKRMQTMKSRMLGGKVDKKGVAIKRDKERDITEEDVIRVLKKEMVKSRLFYNIGKTIQDKEYVEKSALEQDEIEQEKNSDSEQDDIDSLMASTVNDDLDFDPTDFL